MKYYFYQSWGYVVIFLNEILDTKQALSDDVAAFAQWNESMNIAKR